MSHSHIVLFIQSCFLFSFVVIYLCCAWSCFLQCLSPAGKFKLLFSGKQATTMQPYSAFATVYVFGIFVCLFLKWFKHFYWHPFHIGIRKRQNYVLQKSFWRSQLPCRKIPLYLWLDTLWTCFNVWLLLHSNQPWSEVNGIVIIGILLVLAGKSGLQKMFILLLVPCLDYFQLELSYDISYFQLK